MRKQKDVDMIPADWKLALIFLGIGVSPYILRFLFPQWSLFISPKSRAEMHAQAIAFASFVLGVIYLGNRTFDEIGITWRFFRIPCRKIKWNQVEKIVIIADEECCSTMLVLRGCPKPNPQKDQKYDMDFASWHFLKTSVFSHSEKHIHLFEKYWHGEIENKYLLYQKKK